MRGGFVGLYCADGEERYGSFRREKNLEDCGLRRPTGMGSLKQVILWLCRFAQVKSGSLVHRAVSVACGERRMDQDLSRKLARIIHIVRTECIEDPLECVEQVSYLVYLKLIDEESDRKLEDVSPLKATATGLLGLPLTIPVAAGTALRDRVSGKKTVRLIGDLFFPNQAKRYRWSQWRSGRGENLRDFVRDEVFPYMASLTREHPRIAEYFRDSDLKIDDPDVFERVVDAIDKIDFAKTGPDVKGDAFEDMLAHPELLNLNGVPRQIRSMMVEMVAPDLGETVCDPACGTGGLLVEAVGYLLARYSAEPRDMPVYGARWLEERGQSLEQAREEISTLQTCRRGQGEKIEDWESLERSFYGVDASRRVTRIAAMNLLLHGIRQPNLKRADALSDIDGSGENGHARGYDVIVSSPPFGSNVSRESNRGGASSKTRIELRFLEMVMNALAPGGRCAVVVSEAFLSSGISSRAEIRRRLVHDYDLLAVISLPPGVFPQSSGMRTAVVVFRCSAGYAEKDRGNKKVWFYSVREADLFKSGDFPGRDSKIQGGNDIPDVLLRWNDYRESGYREPQGVEAGTVLDPGSGEPRCWWATMEAVAENGYMLSTNLYKPLVAEKPPDESPADLLRETLAIERGIAEDVEKLLRELEVVK